MKHGQIKFCFLLSGQLLAYCVTSCKVKFTSSFNEVGINKMSNNLIFFPSNFQTLSFLRIEMPRMTETFRLDIDSDRKSMCK
jgi:hypothetical protein